MRLYPKELCMMKCVIFGAAGATGRILVERALAQGHEVTAFDRQTPTLTIHRPKFTLVQGDIFNPAQVEEAIASQDVVVSVLGVRPGVTTPVCSKGTEHIIAAMQKLGVKRFIRRSSAGWRMAGSRVLTDHLAVLSKTESHVCRQSAPGARDPAE